MPKRIAIKLKNEKGMTLVELVAAMFVMAIITLSVASVMLPMYRTYDLSNNLAEVNTVLDNVSALIMEDIAGAQEVQFTAGGILIKVWNSENYITYDNTGAAGAFVRYEQGTATGAKHPVLPERYYRNLDIRIDDAAHDGNGLVTITLTLIDRRSSVELSSRDYYARPIAMQIYD